MFSQVQLLSSQDKGREFNDLPDLVREGASLKQILNSVYFPDELALQRNYLIEYLKQKEVIHNLLGFMIKPDDPPTAPQSPECKFAFYAYCVLSTPNDSIIEALLSNQDLLNMLFSPAHSDESRYTTSQGYLMGIIRLLLSDMNPMKNDFISILFKNSGTLIFPLIHNMTSANSAILKEILVTPNPLLAKLQFSIFEYILFFYLNEKFTTSPHACVNDYMFDNLVSIFRHLGNEKIRYEYKLKYEGNLYSIKNIRAKEHMEDLFYLRVCLLRYIAITEQIKKSDRIAELLNARHLFSNGKRKFWLVKEIVGFVKILSGNKEFVGVIDEKVVRELIKIVIDFPKSDIMHTAVFEILMNSVLKIEASPSLLSSILEFLNSLVESSSLPGHPKTLSNKCSLAFCANFLNSINQQMISDIQSRHLVQKLTNKLKNVYTKFEIYKISNSVSIDKSDLVVIIKNPMEMFKFSEALNNEKKNFLEVMPVISPEMMKSHESFRGSMILAENALTNKNLLDNEVLQLRNSLLNSAINNVDEDNSSPADRTPILNKNNLLSIREDGFDDRTLADELYSPNISKHGDKSDKRDRPLNLSKNNLLLLSSSFINP
jgi:hypothetical protein